MIYRWVRNDLVNGVYKYFFVDSNQNRLSWKDVLELLEDKDQNFFPFFQKALSDANSESFPYRWNCSPVSKSGLDKSFEFVVTKESSLTNNSQNYSAFQSYINSSSSPHVCSFKSNSDNIMTIPIPVSGKNFSSISYFIQNASLEQQENFWQKASIELVKEINKNTQETRWLCTEGTGVAYLHVRIDKPVNNKAPSSIFFADYKNPNYTPIPTPRTPKEKVLANLDKICLDPTGDLANAELLRGKVFHDEQDFINSYQNTWELSRLNIEGETIDLKLREGVQEEEWADGAIKRAIINQIKKNRTDWKIEEEGGMQVVKYIKQKNGRKNWKTAFSQQEWEEIETALKTHPKKEQELKNLKKWYNPLDYPLPWIIAIVFSTFLIVITMTFWKRTKKKF